MWNVANKNKKQRAMLLNFGLARGGQGQRRPSPPLRSASIRFGRPALRPPPRCHARCWPASRDRASKRGLNNLGRQGHKTHRATGPNGGRPFFWGGILFQRFFFFFYQRALFPVAQSICKGFPPRFLGWPEKGPSCFFPARESPGTQKCSKTNRGKKHNGLLHTVSWTDALDGSSVGFLTELHIPQPNDRIPQDASRRELGVEAAHLLVQALRGAQLGHESFGSLIFFWVSVFWVLSPLPEWIGQSLATKLLVYHENSLSKQF